MTENGAPIAPGPHYSVIAGEEWSSGGELLPVHNAATGEVISHVEEGGEAAVTAAVEAAEQGYAHWRRLTPAERGRKLLDLAEAMEANAERLISIESLNTGRSPETIRDELSHSVDAFRFYAGAGRLLEGKATGEYLPNKTSMIRRDPIGICGHITPWNYPLMMAALALAPALAGGNASVLKPSELTPLTSLELAKLAADVLPAGVLNVVTGSGLPTGDALVKDPNVRIISLIGDVGTGRTIMQNAAVNLKRLHLELGGKAPVIVYDDADMQLLARTLKIGSFQNAGQDCTAATRLLVGKKSVDQFLESFMPVVENIVVGGPDTPGVEMGPVISQTHRNRVLGMVERAQDNGAEILTGGSPHGDKGYFVKPTIVFNPHQTSEIVQKEVFGPVVTVQPFDDENSAIKWANDSEYGLSASIWSRDAGRLFRTAKDLEFGTVWLNDHFPMAMEMPHGGFKQSGSSKDQSMYALEDYTTIKHLMLNLDDKS